MVRSDEFWASAGGKVRTLVDDLVATCRVLEVEALAPTTSGAFARRIAGLPDSAIPFDWPRPDGLPDDADAWAATTRMLTSWRVHWSLAGGEYPRQDVR